MQGQVAAPKAATPTAAVPQSSARALHRYEDTWAVLAQRNMDICGRAREAAGAVINASTRVGEVSAAWGQLRTELQGLPQCASQLRALASSVASACARIDVLEHRLHDAALARAELDVETAPLKRDIAEKEFNIAQKGAKVAKLAPVLAQAAEHMPDEAASEMIAMRFSPARNASFSRKLT